MINFTNNKTMLWQKDLVLLAVLNVFIFTQGAVLSSIAGIIFLAAFPGVLIQRLLAYRAEFVWERIVHTVALSISFVLFGGLLVNTILPALNIIRPLEQLPVLISFDVLLLLIITLNAFLKKETRIFFDGVSLQNVVVKVAHHMWLFVLPLSAIVGATMLNNGGSNIVSGVAISAVAVFLLYAVTAEKPSRENFITTGLYCSSLALLLVSSMRSSHVLGWDVNAELQVFRLTQTAAYWSMSHMQDAYNACLSITLLPTVFLNFVHLSDEYMYKFLFQFIFALMPLSVYYFVRTFTNARMAVFATAMLIGNAVFSHGMPALIRQEFGFLYFGLVLLVLFSSGIQSRTRTILAIIYGLSIVVSHYSTTYITVFLFASTVALNFGLSFAKKVFPRFFPGHVSRSIRLWYVIFLLAGMLTWGSVITKTANNLSGFIDHSRSNIAESFTYDTWSRAVAQLFTQYPRFENIEQYKNRETAHFRELHLGMTFYDDEHVEQAVITSKTFAQSPGILGPQTKVFAGKVFQMLKLVLNNLFIVVGMILLIYQWYARKFKSSEFILLGASGFFALALILVLPDALTQYNIDRLYFQLLVVWATLSVTAGLFTFLFLPVRTRLITLGTMYVTLMLFYSSFIFSVTGGPAFVSMNNFGSEYEKFYVHDSEVDAAQWLGNRAEAVPIFSNSSGYLRLRSHGNVDPHQIFMTTLPSMIDKDSYVFLTRMSTVSGISTYIFYNEEYAYSAPIDFLNNNKDAIYDSGLAKIFR